MASPKMTTHLLWALAVTRPPGHRKRVIGRKKFGMVTDTDRSDLQIHIILTKALSPQSGLCSLYLFWKLREFYEFLRQMLMYSIMTQDPPPPRKTSVAQILLLHAIFCCNWNMSYPFCNATHAD